MIGTVKFNESKNVILQIDNTADVHRIENVTSKTDQEMRTGFFALTEENVRKNAAAKRRLSPPVCETPTKVRKSFYFIFFK